jgi:hypothetical protein
MREIKFRVKNIKGEWAYFHVPDALGVISHFAEEYDWKTMTQLTGLKDKNGKEIYEGDILDFENGYKDVIEFFNGCFKLQQSGYMDNMEHGKVIGNIYENPELLTNK